MIEVNWNPDRKALRTFGGIGCLAFGGLGAWSFFRHGLPGLHFEPATAQNVAYGFWAAAAVCGLLALVAPQLLKGLYLGLTIVSLPIGFVVSHVVMALMYYGIVTPIGLFFRCIGRDSMCRKLDREASTYWVRREPVSDVKRYFRQF